jgi:hypothetical protein
VFVFILVSFMVRVLAAFRRRRRARRDEPVHRRIAAMWFRA